MTWPMHDAGPTTPEPGSRETGGEPGPPEPDRARVRPARPARRGRRSAAAAGRPDAGRRPEPGRDDAAAGARVARAARPAAPDPPVYPRGPARLGGRAAGLAPGAPDDRVPAAGRPAAAAPAAGLPAATGNAAGRARRAGRSPASRAASGGAAAVSVGRAARRPAVEPGPLQRRHGGRHPGLPGHRVPAHPGPDRRDRRRRAQRRVQQREHPAEHHLLPHARRRLHQRGGAAAGSGSQARPGPRRGLRAAHVHPRRGGPARGHRSGDAAGGAAGRPVRAHHPRPGRQSPGRRARPDGGVGLLLHPADLLLRHELADRGDPEHPRPVRGADVDAGHQQPDRDRGRRALRGDAPGQGAVDHLGGRGAAARDRYHARRRGADRRAGPVAAGGRVPMASHARVPARRGERDGPDGRLDVGLRGLPVGRLPRRPDRGERGLGRD